MDLRARNLYDSKEIRDKAYPNGQTLNFKSIKLDKSEVFSSKTYRYGAQLVHIESSLDYKPSVENATFLEPIDFMIIPMFPACKFLPFDEKEAFYYSDDLDNFVFLCKKDGRNFKVFHEEAIKILRSQPLYSYLDIKIRREFLKLEDDGIDAIS